MRPWTSAGHPVVVHWGTEAALQPAFARDAPGIRSGAVQRRTRRTRVACGGPDGARRAGWRVAASSAISRSRVRGDAGGRRGGSIGFGRVDRSVGRGAASAMYRPICSGSAAPGRIVDGCRSARPADRAAWTSASVGLTLPLSPVALHPGLDWRLAARPSRARERGRDISAFSGRFIAPGVGAADKGEPSRLDPR